MGRFARKVRHQHASEQQGTPRWVVIALVGLIAFSLVWYVVINNIEW